MQSLTSVTTGLLSQVAEAATATGRQHGDGGSEQQLIVSETTAREWLLAQPSPRATDEALCRSLTSTLNVTPTLKTENRFPVDGGYYSVVVGCTYEIADPANVAPAAAKLRAAMTPATADQVEGWLVLLQAATAARPASEASAAVAYALYASELRQYPADVAKAACANLARGERGKVTWFPTLGEVIDACEELGHNRKAMLLGLEGWYPKPERGTPTEPPQRSEEDKQRVRDMLASYHAEQAEREAAKPKRPELPPIHGKTDEHGITKEMRELLKRQNA